MVAKRPASAYSVRSMTASAGRVRGRVAVADRVGRGRIRDEGDLVAEIGGEPGRGLAALLGPDSGDHQLPDAMAGQQLLEVGRGERVVRGLGQHRFAVSRGQWLDETDEAAGRVEGRT